MSADASPYSHGIVLNAFEKVQLKQLAYDDVK